MKRFLICALTVGFLAGPAMAEPAVEVWLQARDGTNKVTLGVSETAVIQLWVSAVGINEQLVNISAALRGYTAAFSKILNYEIQGFNDITIPNSQMQRGNNRGPNIAGLLPNAHPDEYLFFALDPTTLLGDSGLQGDNRAVLLDEIIIHGVTQNDFTDEGGLKESDLLIFAQADFKPSGFFMEFSQLPLPTGSWATSALSVITTGTGTFPGGEMFINVTPEPATLGLIALGGFAAIRRRR